MEILFKLNNLEYYKYNLFDYEFKTDYYVPYCKFLLYNEYKDDYHFIFKTHDKINIIYFEQYNKYIYEIKIKKIDELLKYIEKISFNHNILKINSKFSILKNEYNEIISNNIFKIDENYELKINLKFHEILIEKGINKDELIEDLYPINEIIKNKF